MSLLEREPLGTVRSLNEFFALAQAMVADAATGYEALAATARARGQTAVAERLGTLAGEDHVHLANLTRWSVDWQHKIPDPSAMPWAPPRAMDPEAGAELASSQLMTPYRVMALAVRNKGRAFAFWSYVAAQAEPREVQDAAEAMAREELRRAAALRVERRQAFHAARRTVAGAAASDAPGGAEPVNTIAALETQLARLLERCLPALEGAAADRSRAFIADGRAAAMDMRAAAPGAMGDGQHTMSEIAERLVALYLEAAERSTDHAHLVWAQARAEVALARLAWLRTLP